jgi:hypothetical protein
MEKIIKPFNQKIFTLGIGAAISGILVGLFGIVVMMLRVKLAVVFLNARVFFDMPFAQGDAIKIGMVTLAALVIVLSGVGIFASGTIVSLGQYSRKQTS